MPGARRGGSPGVLVLLLACAPTGGEPPPCEERYYGFEDRDGDGWGDASRGWRSCEPLLELVGEAGDCDNADPGVNPGATETCGGGDEDCDGRVDDEDPGVSGLVDWYADADGDGWGAGEVVAVACEGAGLAPGGDCDDADPALHPGAAEVCDGLDNDCDPATDEAGTATWTPTGGAPEDWTTRLRGALTLDAPGALAVCEGAWPVALEVAADVRLAGHGGATLQPDTTGITIEGGPWEVGVAGLAVEGGVGSVDLTGDGRLAGGALACRGGSAVLLEDVRFTGGTAALGGAFAVDGCYVYAWRGELSANTAEQGGAVYLAEGHLEVNQFEVRGNTASLEGGAVAVDPGRAEAFMVLGDTLLTDNEAPIAGAVSLRGDTVMHVYGTNRERAGALANRSDTGGVILTDDRSGIEFIGADLGVTGTGDDNLPADVTTLAGDYALGDDLLGWCWSEGCFLVEG